MLPGYRAPRKFLFLSTLSLRRATCLSSSYNLAHPISIHALLAESDHKRPLTGHALAISIHALLAESDGVYWYSYATTPAISIHALLAESDTWQTISGSIRPISIHALLAESDCAGSCPVRRGVYFYPRSPCGERQ